MQAAVANAGGIVTTDLSPVGAMAVAPVARDFGARIGANSSVADFFPESMFDGPVTFDGGRNLGPVGTPDFGKSHSFPDPWHDASSFLGVTNPEGILQWDDGRMDVPSAWSTTLGDKTIRVAVLDTGVQKSHRELKDNLDGKAETFVPCDALRHAFAGTALTGAGPNDFGTDGQDGHGALVATPLPPPPNAFA